MYIYFIKALLVRAS